MTSTVARSPAGCASRPARPASGAASRRSRRSSRRPVPPYCSTGLRTATDAPESARLTEVPNISRVTDTMPAERELRRVIGDGDAIPDGEVEGIGEQELLALYRSMVLLRTYDERSVVYHRQGRIGTYAIFWGHEAIQAGAFHALDEDDWIFPSYRESAIGLLRGMPRGDDPLLVARPSGRLVEPGRLQRRLDLRPDRDARAACGRAGLGRSACAARAPARSPSSATARPRRAPSTKGRTSPP